MSRLMFRSSEGLLDVPEPDLVTGSVGEGGKYSTNSVFIIIILHLRAVSLYVNTYIPDVSLL